MANGKLIGKDITPTAEVTPNGVWNLADQYVYGRRDVWPISSTGLANSQTYSYTGSTQTFDVSSIDVVYAKLWGAGGGGPKVSDTGSRTGGAGGYTSILIDTSGINTLTLYVGQGGTFGPSSTAGQTFGFGPGEYGQGGGQGGGGTAILSGSTVIAVAGGGGAAAATNAGFFTGDASGGAGGGVNGQNGLGNKPGGGAQGATGGVAQDVGDATDGENAGSADGGQGGLAGGGGGDAGGAGGGGGYAGGAGGGGGSELDEGGGGGGSGYINTAFALPDTAEYITETITGDREVPGNSTDPDLSAGLAVGGGPGQVGGNGFIKIYY